MNGAGSSSSWRAPRGPASPRSAALAARMRESGLDPVVVREPGSTRAAELAREALLDPEHPVGPVAELFLYLAARADLVAGHQTSLKAGHVVLSDRFAMTTEAYQIAGRGIPRGGAPGQCAATGAFDPISR